MEADGKDILTFGQAQAMAGVWFSTVGKVQQPTKAPYLVRDAVEAYRQEAERDGQSMTTLNSAIDTHILPALGEKVVEEFTVDELKDWHAALARAPKRRTGQKTSEPGEWKGPPTEEQLRARKNTANRILAILKRALNLAVENEKVSGNRTPWVVVKPFKKVGGQRLRFLAQDEQQRLVNGAPEEFRPLVRAALYTGSRYSPLTRMLVQDFNPEAGTVFIQKDKGGKARHVVLDAEGITWFRRHTLGRNGDEPMFTRAGVKRSAARKGKESVWVHGDQDWQMELAVENSGIARVTFHELRHTYASDLIKRGVQLSYVADQLGHADTRMVEKHYGHLCPSDKAKTIRKKSPKRGIGGEEDKAEALKIKGA